MPAELSDTAQVRFERSTITQRPEIATSMMSVLCLWSEMDYRWGVVLAEMLEAEASAGVVMYNAIDNQTAKARLLKAISADRLSPPHQKEFITLTKEAEERTKLRNKIAHGQWGGQPNDLEGVVLGEGKWASVAAASLLSVRHGTKTLLGGLVQPMKMNRYVVDDFLKEADMIARLIDRQVSFASDIAEYRRTLRYMAHSVKT